MSVMKTFTVRDLNRSSAAVLAAADHDGLAVVCGRDGRAYDVRPRAKPAKKPDWAKFLARRRRRLKELFPEGPIMTRGQAQEFDRLLAADARLL
jgi:hypothetical protein